MLRILRYPDPRLSAPAAPVTAFGAELKQLVDQLAAAMDAAPGIGITAPHVGEPWRLVLLRLPPANQLEIYVNPQILKASSDLRRHEEGSVSMPGMAAEVERPAAVTVGYRDLFGVERTVEADGLRAVCLQHEIDQLDGLFWIERLSKLKRDRLLKRWRKHGGA